MKVYVAFDRIGHGKNTMGAYEKGYGNRGMKPDGGRGGLGKEAKWETNDKRRFVDVVSGRFKREERDNRNMDASRTNQKNSEDNERFMGDLGSNRIIEIEEKDGNSEIMARSVVGEVKAMCFLTKLPVLCDEHGLCKIEVKLLGGLEVMAVFENKETANNVLTNVEHGLRRWIYKIRSGDSFHRTAGRITWISILGIPVSCWGELVLRNIANLHATILGMHNCSLKGNQNTVCGRVQIHTINKGLIKEDLHVKFKGKLHKVSVVEEARDIINWDIQEVSQGNQEDYEVESNKGNENEMQVDGASGEDTDESNSEGEESSDEEEEREPNGGEKYRSQPEMASGDRRRGEEGRSSFSGETRVSETFNGMYASSKEKPDESSTKIMEMTGGVAQVRKVRWASVMGST